jgi:flagellar biosynthetic protein FliQ
VTENEAVNLLAKAIFVATELALPILLVSLVVGVAISLVQAVTQVQEMTLTFVPKLAAIAVVIVVSGRWMISELVDYTQELFAMLPTLVR